MSTLETKKIEPLSGTSVTLGAAGDAVTMPAGVTVKTNTVKDAGGNTLWTSDGSGTLSNVNSALQGNMVFISSQLVTSSVSAIEITSGITSTYDEYVFYIVNWHQSNDDYHCRFIGSTNGGSSYGITSYLTRIRAIHAEGDGSTEVSYDTNQDQTDPSTNTISLTDGIGNDADQTVSGVFHLYSPSSTTYVKHFTATFNGCRGNDRTTAVYTGGYMNTTSAVNAIKFKSAAGTVDSCQLYLYGIR